VDSAILCTEHERLIQGVYLERGEPTIFPYSRFHRLGGGCEIMSPREVTVIQGISGHGKTTLMECMADELLLMGVDVLWIGQEKTPNEYYARARYRWGGIHPQRLKKWKLYLSEVQRAVPENLRLGVALTPRDREMDAQAGHIVRTWPGCLHVWDYAGKYLEAKFQLIAETIEELRKKGRRPNILFVDYAQLEKPEHMEDNKSEAVMSLLKDFCMQMDIHGILGTQVTKTGAKTAKDGERIGSDSSMYLRDFQANTWLSINLDYDNGVRLKSGVIKVDKNTNGETGEIVAVSDFAHGKWIIP
jgi:hypothetical protein